VAGAQASRAGGDPTQAVVRFYQLAEQHAFDQAAQLWSPSMQAAYPPAGNINQRFANTARLKVQQVQLVSLDQASGRAVVAVDLQEILNSGAGRHYVGTWDLVRDPNGWLLNRPNLRAA
jgi:hypothetical protein